jgi:hypothetical protein
MLGAIVVAKTCKPKMDWRWACNFIYSLWHLFLA